MGGADAGMSQTSGIPDTLGEARRRRRVKIGAAVCVAAFIIAFCAVYAFGTTLTCEIQVYVSATSADLDEVDVVVYVDGEAVAEWEGLEAGKAIVVTIMHHVGILGGTVTVSAESTAGLTDSAEIDVSAGGSYSLTLYV